MPPLPKPEFAVFLLGAGASAEFGPPVMRDFMRFARHRYHRCFGDGKTGLMESLNWQVKLSDHYERMFDFHAHCEAGSPKLQRNWDNIEELYTQADFRRLAGVRGATEICESIKWVLWDIYRVAITPNLASYQGVIKQLAKPSLRPIIISTNYDLIAERAASLNPNSDVAHYGAFVYAGFGDDTIAGQGIRAISTYASGADFSSKLNIIKLHGSVNWFETDKGEVLCHSTPDALTDRSIDNETHRGGTTALADFHRDLANSPHFGQDLTLTPVIIPPMLGKASTHPIIELQWRAAIHAISRAAQVWIVGYSFPQTDAFMQRLLHEGLSRNRGLDNFIIADIQPETLWEDRLDKLFNPIMRREQLTYYEIPAQKLFAILANHDASTWPTEITTFIKRRKAALA